jgi:antitoxin component of MazEF toxin-antitoxin module
MSKKINEAGEVIALATVFQDGTSVRGKIPYSVVKALKAKDSDVLAFERQSNGAVIVRKSTASERKTVDSRSKKKGKR